MKKNSIILTSLLLSSAGAVHYIQGSPAGETLDPVKKEITETFIEVSSENVAQDSKRDDRRSVSVKFQEYLETNEKATKVFQVYQSGTGEFSMQVINLEDDINQKFKKKTDDLSDINKAAAQNETWSKIGVGMGVIALAGGIMGASLGGDKVLCGVAGTVGLSVDIASFYFWARSLEAQHNSKTHIEQNIIMNEKWRNQFYEAKKHRPKN